MQLGSGLDQLYLSVLLSHVRHWILEQHGVQAHQRVQQRHVAKVLHKVIQAVLSLLETLLLGQGIF